MSEYRIVQHHTECVVDSRDKLGEGAFWSAEDRAVYWLDIAMPSRLHRFMTAEGRHQTWTMPEMISAMARRQDGSLLVASQGGLSFFDPHADPARPGLKRVLSPETDRPSNRSNDGAPDAKGRFWIGTMQNNLGPDDSEIPVTEKSGTLWRIDPELHATAMETGIGIANGIVWSPDNRVLYMADSMLQSVFAYDFDLGAGTIRNKRVLNAVKDLGSPDGATMDAEGFIWSARWEGSCVARIAPDGGIDCVVPIPATRVTSCAFGGEDLGTLYVTTSRQNVDAAVLAKYPQQGGLFALRPGVRGLQRPLFGG